jgi:hypothetical protein
VAVHLSNILETEEVGYELSDIALLINSAYPDIRRVINSAQRQLVNGHIAECILVLGKYELSDAQVVDKEINAMAMIIEILGVIK